MTSESDWPDTVPVLRPENIYQGGLHGNDGTHCLLGWAEVTFRGEALAAVVETLERLLPGRYGDVAWFNDMGTKARAAKHWNKTMAEVGYNTRRRRQRSATRTEGETCTTPQP